MITMKSTVFPQVNDTALAQKVNNVLTSIFAPAKIISNSKPIMGSEDFNHLVPNNNKTACDYIWIGTANPDVFAKAIREGKQAPYFNHNGNYQVDLAAIPLGVQTGVTALLEIFKKQD